MDPTLLTISEASALIAAKKLSPVDLAKACIAKTEKLDPTLKAYVTFTPELALEAAKTAEKKRWPARSARRCMASRSG